MIPKHLCKFGGGRASQNPVHHLHVDPYLRYVQLGGKLLLEAVAQYRLAQRIDGAVDVDGLLLSLAEKVAAERVVTVDALMNGPAADAPRALRSRAPAGRRMRC